MKDSSLRLLKVYQRAARGIARSIFGGRKAKNGPYILRKHNYTYTKNDNKLTAYIDWGAKIKSQNLNWG